MQSTPAIIILPVCNDNICSGFSGHAQLANFYNTAKQYHDISIQLSFKKVSRFDANMISLFSALLYILNYENGLSFTVEYKDLSQKFEALLQSSFLKIEGDVSRRTNLHTTTLPYSHFQKGDKKGFLDYIDQSLMSHPGMVLVDEKIKDQIKDDLIELMTNVYYHSNSDHPFFVCGQLCPQDDCIKLTMTDLGEGFLPKINTITSGVITTDIEAISWALSGKTTKPLDGPVPGGLGIKNIYNYCKQNNGTFSIATGKAFWSTDLAPTVQGPFRHLPYPISGSTINLHFRTK